MVQDNYQYGKHQYGKQQTINENLYRYLGLQVCCKKLEHWKTDTLFFYYSGILKFHFKNHGPTNKITYQQICEIFFLVLVQTHCKLQFVEFFSETYLFGVVKLNLGPKNLKTSFNSSLCYCNLNDFAGHNFSSLSLIEAYNTHHKFDMECVYETSLEASFAIDYPRLDLIL